MKYRKRPILVDAIQWQGNNQAEILDFARDSARFVHFDKTYSALYIDTLEGIMRANIDDYIIKGVVGELYPCDKYIFEQTYEPVVD